MRANNIKPSEAAEILGVATQFVRIGLQMQFLKIGTAIKMPGSSQWTYNITPGLLADYTGFSMEEIFEKIKQIRNLEGRKQ